MSGTDNPSFMVDHMLIKVGKYLRIIGYDAEWDKLVRTHELILRANRQDRIFLTCNTRLPDQYPKPSRVMVLEHSDPVTQLGAVVRAFSLDTAGMLFSRCIRCNVVLETVQEKESVRAKVHPNVFGRHEKFYTCPQCGTVFWKGSHVWNTCRKLGFDG